MQVDYTLTLDIPDQLPSHLLGEEVHLTQNMSQLMEEAGSQASSRKSLRGKQAAINLPERTSLPSESCYSDALDDLSELLAPGLDSMGGENPLDIPFEDLDGSSAGGVEPGPASKKSSKAPSASFGSPGQPSSAGHGADVSEYDSLIEPEPADVYDLNNMVCRLFVCYHLNLLTFLHSRSDLDILAGLRRWIWQGR